MSIDSFSVLSIDFLFNQKLFCSIHSFSVLLMWQIYLNYHQRMGILPLKKRVNRDKCSFACALYATLHYSKVIISLNLKVIPICSPFRLLP